MILRRCSRSVSIIRERFASAALPALILTLGHIIPKATSVIDSWEAMLIINTACTSTHAFFIVIAYQ